MKHKNKIRVSSTDAETAFHKLFRQVDEFIEKEDISRYTIKHKIVHDSTRNNFIGKAKVKYKKNHQ